MRVGAAGLALCIALPAFAGGPLGVCSNTPTKYSGAGTVTLNYDQGNLGSRLKVDADALVTQAVSLWTNVATATVTLARGSDLPEDVTAANYLNYVESPATFGDGKNPVVYDTDGSIIDLIFGTGAKNVILGFAGSGWSVHPGFCQYTEGEAVISGFISVTDTTMKVVFAHEIGHLIGLDHSQLDAAQGLANSNDPLMYPIARRTSVTLHEDDIAAVSALYPDVTLSSVYGQLSGNFTQADGTPIRGANLWAKEINTGKVFSIVSDYLMQNTGYFKLLLPAGTYTLHAEAIRTNFNSGSSVGPYSEVYPADPAAPSPSYSFLPPLYVNGTPMAALMLGNGSPTQIVMTAGCVGTAAFKFDGTGSIGGNCGVTPPAAPTINGITAGNGTATVSFTAPASDGGRPITGYTVTCTAGGQATRSNTGSGSPITVPGLTGGIAYSCSVTASNNIGASLSSATLSVTPLAANNMAPIWMLLLD